MKTRIEELVSQTLSIEVQHIGIAHLPAGHTTRWRTMPYFMFSQAWEGSERILLENGRKIDADEGRMIVLAAGIRHKVDVISPGESRHWAHVIYTIANGVDLFSIIECPILVDRDIGMVVGKLVLDWAGKARSRGTSGLEQAVERQEAGVRLLRLIAPLCRLRVGAMERLEKAKRLGTAIRHMHANVEQSIRRDELARMAGLSPAQFHVVFREIMGTTPVAYLRDLRLRRAQHLLISTNLPIKDVALRCGYEDPFVFSKFFTRAWGHSPSEYRELMAKQ
jgi:AraC-like DNA-binding protein